MEMSYLGIYEWVYRMVLDHIFTPVFDFVASLLNGSIGWVFENLTGPIILPILQTVIEWIGRVYWFLVGIFAYMQYQMVLTLVDYLEKAFDIFIGLTPVLYYPDGYSAGAEPKPLLETLFSMPTINKAFWVITISGVAIAMLLTIYGVARSAFDLDFENKKPVSHVLTQMFKSLIGAFLIPFMVVALLQISSIILKTVDNAVNMSSDSGGSTLGSALFVLSSVNAAWNPNQNMTTRKPVVAEDYGEQDIPFKLEVKDVPNPEYEFLGKNDPRVEFYNNDETYNYKQTLAVGSWFNYGAFDYFTGFIAAIFMLIIMFMCLLTFIRRLFELLLLYLVSPYFVALIPLDDGERFKQWFSMFLGKLFTGYGSVIIMKIYLMLCPMFIGGGLQLKDAGIETRTTMYLIFIVGGGWAVLKSGTVLTELINTQAAQAERQSMNAAGGFLRTMGGMAMAPLESAKDIAQQSMVEGISGSIIEGKRNREQRKNAILESYLARGEAAARGGRTGAGGGRLKPPNKPLPPTPGSRKHIPPNKPLPPTPGSRKHIPPSKPLPPTPGSRKHIPPNKPLPPTPGSGKHIPPNKPLPPTPGSGKHIPPNKPLPPTPGSRKHIPPNKPLPLTPGGGKLTPKEKAQTPKPESWKFAEPGYNMLSRRSGNRINQETGEAPALWNRMSEGAREHTLRQDARNAEERNRSGRSGCPQIGGVAKFTWMKGRELTPQERENILRSNPRLSGRRLPRNNRNGKEDKQ